MSLIIAASLALVGYGNSGRIAAATSATGHASHYGWSMVIRALKHGGYGWRISPARREGTARRATAAAGSDSDWQSDEGQMLQLPTHDVCDFVLETLLFG
jgi:hypothetical protein